MTLFRRYQQRSSEVKRRGCCPTTTTPDPIDKEPIAHDKADVNLILLEPGELDDNGVTHLTGRRAQHLSCVLRAPVGASVRVGVVDGGTGAAEVLAIDRHNATLRVSLTEARVPASDDTLILAIARPKVLLRCLEHATALGFGRIALIRTKRVDKNHLLASSLEEDAMGRRLRLGLEQSRRTSLPRMSVHRRFRAFMEQEVQTIATGDNRFVAHQDADLGASETTVSPGPLTLVIGPEGGLLDFEVEAFQGEGFAAVHFGSAPLRVETALSFATGHLRALRDVASPSPEQPAANSVA